MKVQEIKNIQNCRKLVIMCDFLLDSQITKEFIDHLSTLGNCEYYTNFPKPFFKIHLPCKGFLKGAKDNSTLRLTFLESNTLEIIDNIIHNFVIHTESYQI